jgi:predicted DsbA family dithiol-disulfide isomerase
MSTVKDDVRTVLHWYDFICPFCYIGQQRNAILRRRGLVVFELAFEAHPEIPVGGIQAGPRDGRMYATLEREAKEAGLPLRWPRHLPNTRKALAAAEWVRRYRPISAARFHRQLFEAHFALGQDLEDQRVIDEHATDSDIDLAALRAALDDGSAARLVDETEVIGRGHGVYGTPAWFLNDQLIAGLGSAVEFEDIAEQALEAMA